MRRDAERNAEGIVAKTLDKVWLKDWGILLDRMDVMEMNPRPREWRWE